MEHNISLPPSLPRWHREPTELLRERIRLVGLALVAEGLTVNSTNLRARGVRGESAAMIRVRNRLVDAGELPRSALGPRADEETPVELPPRVTRNSDELRVASRGQIQPSSLATRHSPLASKASDATADLDVPPTPTEESIERYNAAVKRIFGAGRARAMGAVR